MLPGLFDPPTESAGKSDPAIGAVPAPSEEITSSESTEHELMTDGEFLRARHGADLLGEDGSEQNKVCSRYDLTYGTASRDVRRLCERLVCMNVALI